MAYSIKLAVKKPKWLPCSGFCVAIAGKGFCVVAADQRITGGSDPSDSSIIFETVPHKGVLATSMYLGDWKMLRNSLSLMKWAYEEDDNNQWSCRLACRVLYEQLFFNDFYRGHHFNVLGGLDIDGDGCVFIYDDFESCKQVKYASQGCGSVQILKFMEEQMKSYSSSTPEYLPTQDDVPSLSEAQAVDLVEKVFRYGIGKDMYAGKKFEIVVINATNGISRRVLDIEGD